MKTKQEHKAGWPRMTEQNIRNESPEERKLRCYSEANGNSAVLQHCFHTGSLQKNKLKDMIHHKIRHKENYAFTPEKARQGGYTKLYLLLILQGKDTERRQRVMRNISTSSSKK